MDMGGSVQRQYSRHMCVLRNHFIIVFLISTVYSTIRLLALINSTTCSTTEGVSKASLYTTLLWCAGKDRLLIITTTAVVSKINHCGRFLEDCPLRQLLKHFDFLCT
jgi:hypothetical protein